MQDSRHGDSGDDRRRSLDLDQPIRHVGIGGRTEEFLPNDLTPALAERRLDLEVVEWLYVYDPSVIQIARFRGTANEVDLSDELKSADRSVWPLRRVGSQGSPDRS